MTKPDEHAVSAEPVADINPGRDAGRLHDVTPTVAVRWTLFDAGQLAVGELEPGEPPPGRTAGQTLWLDISGTPGKALLQQLQDELHLHPLALEDVQNARQLPKVEAYEQHLFCVVRRPVIAGNDCYLAQDCLFLGPDFLVTQHDESSLLDPIHRRLAESRGRIRKSGTDYLFYACLDLLVDYGFLTAAHQEEALQGLEDRLFDPRPVDLTLDIYGIRRKLGELHRSLSLQTLMLESLTADSAFIDDAHEHYLRDCCDHSQRLEGRFLHLHEAAGDLLNTQLALSSHRLNDIMRVLTVMAAIFIPLTFVTGIYGMNFDTSFPYNMPELGWRFGYLAVLGGMLAAVLGLVWHFRRKRWL